MELNTKQIVLDAGPIISLSGANLLYLFEELHNRFNVEFLIPESVKLEVVDKALQTRRFKHNALDVLYYIGKGIFKIVKSSDLTSTTELLMHIANHIFLKNEHPISILHPGETEVFAVMIKYHLTYAVIDEIAAKQLFENPHSLQERFSNKMHTKIDVNLDNLNLLLNQLLKPKFFRSSELIIFSFENGIFDKYLNIPYQEHTNIQNIKAEILEALLWQIKLNGCAITTEEIYQIINFEHSEGKL